MGARHRSAARRSSSSTNRSPTSTPRCAYECAASSRGLHRERGGSTIIYVTHDQVEAMTHSPRGRRCSAWASCSKPDRRSSCTTGRRTNSWRGFWALRVILSFLTYAPDGREAFRARLHPPRPGRPATADGEVLLGLRPQELRVCRQGPLKGQIEAVERLGFDGLRLPLRRKPALGGALRPRTRAVHR